MLNNNSVKINCRKEHSYKCYCSKTIYFGALTKTSWTDPVMAKNFLSLCVPTRIKKTPIAKGHKIFEVVNKLNYKRLLNMFMLSFKDKIFTALRLSLAVKETFNH